MNDCEYSTKTKAYLYDNSGENIEKTFEIYSCLIEDITSTKDLPLSCPFPARYCKYREQKDDFKESCGKIILENLED